MPSRRPQSLTSEVESVLGPAPTDYAQPEVVVLRLRRHGRRLVLPVLVLVVVAAASGYWIGTLPAAWMNLVAGGGAIAIALLLGVFPVLGWLTRRTTVTTRRVIQRRGVFSRHRSEVAFVRVREVRTRRTLGQRMCGAGDIDLFVGAEQATIVEVPGVATVADALQELVERNYAHASRVERRLGTPQTSNVTFTPVPEAPRDSFF
ncbi:PH domain-containing protein [Leucobacter sp. NPDC058333]|uniref:PH domain-containing protein n=1 Tax=Leucobacter sp. NPDC058333 TaxID=3346450 RepID=UPI00366706E3